MALSNTTNRYQTGALSGIANGNTVATWSSRISAESDLKVYVVESDGTTTLLTLDVDYEIDPTLNGTLITSCDINVLDATKFPDGSIVIVIRETNFLQASDYATNGVILSDTLENDLDKLAMQAQQLKDDITRSVRFSATLTSTPDPEISFDATARSNKVLGFDASGDFAVTQELGTFVGDWTDGTDYQTRDIVRTWGLETDDNYGSLWIAKQSHTADAASGKSPDDTYPLASNDYWDLILDTGHFATQADVAATNANTSESKATEAQDWANKTDGDVEVDDVGSGEYSAKAYAIGGTGVTGAAGKGSAKEWAIGGGSTFDLNTTVDGTNYSAKYWATRADVGTVADNINSISAVATSVSNVNEVANDLSGQSYDSIPFIDYGTLSSPIEIWGNSDYGTLSNQVAGNYDGGAINAVRTYLTEIQAVADVITGTVNYLYNVSTVATEIGNLGTTAAVEDLGLVAGQISPTNNLSTVAGLETEIGNLGTASVSTALSNLSSSAVHLLALSGSAADLAALSGSATALSNLSGSADDLDAIANGYDGTTATSGTNTNLYLINQVVQNLGQLVQKLSLTGGTMTGAINMGGNNITNVGTIDFGSLA